MTRRLSLSRETLSELTSYDLAQVNGAGEAITPYCPTMLFRNCTTWLTCDPTCFTEA